MFLPSSHIELNRVFVETLVRVATERPWCGFDIAQSFLPDDLTAERPTITGLAARMFERVKTEEDTQTRGELAENLAVLLADMAAADERVEPGVFRDGFRAALRDVAGEETGSYDTQQLLVLVHVVVLLSAMMARIDKVEVGMPLLWELGE